MTLRNVPVASAAAPGFILLSRSGSPRPVETEGDAAFSAGIALKTLDDLVRSERCGRAAGARVWPFDPLLPPCA